MASRLNPYISFGGDARAAMERYRDVFGGELHLNTFGEFGTDGPDADKVMHAQLETSAGYTIMGADTPTGMDRHQGDTVTISLSGDDEDALRSYWDGLTDGGQVTMPLDKQMWGDTFGMCIDRFGIGWMVNISAPADAGETQ